MRRWQSTQCLPADHLTWRLTNISWSHHIMVVVQHVSKIWYGNGHACNYIWPFLAIDLARSVQIWRFGHGFEALSSHT